MSRITWNNVDAPNFRDALAGTELGAALLGRGMAGLGNVVADVDARKKDQASRAAIARALGITDAGALQQQLQTGGISSFGISPNNLTDEALKFFANRTGDLLDNERTQTGIDQARVNMSLAQSREGRAVEAYDLQHDRNLLSFAGEQQAWNDNQKSRAILTEGRAIADEVAKLPLSQEQARQEIISQNLAPDLEASALSALGSLDGAHWAIAPENSLLNDPNASGNYQVILDTVAQRNAERNFATGGNKLLQLYDEGSQTFSDYASPLTGLIDTLKNPAASEAQAENWAGNLTNTFNDLRSKTNLPDEIVATVMRNNLRGTNLFDLSLGNVKIDKDAIESELNYLASDENRKGLSTSLAAVKRDRATAQRLTDQLEQERARYERAKQRGNEDVMQRALANMERIRQQTGAWARTDIPGRLGSNITLGVEPSPPERTERSGVADAYMRDLAAKGLLPPDLTRKYQP